MLKAVADFESSIIDALNLGSLYQHLKTQGIPMPAEDLLRAQVAYSVGAFDKLMHDLIRIGMVDIFAGKRSPTARYLAETFDLQTWKSIHEATLPPPAAIFEIAVVKKHSHVSFQDPVKVAEGLSLIWGEQQKWERIAAVLGLTAAYTRTTLKLIVQRRNAIVHESDMHPVTKLKSPITQQEAQDMSDFMARCGRAIASLL
jgi:hypothetical protein